MKDLIEKLSLLDIPKREAEVYLALLHKKEFTAPEIARITSVNRTKAYEVLQNLVKKGLCNESFRNGIKVFNAVNPKNVLENILMDYEQKKRVAEQLHERLDNLFKANEQNANPVDYIEVLTDINQIREKWFEIQSNTKKEFLTFIKPPYTMRPEENMKSETKQLFQRMVCKGLYEYGSLTSVEEIDNLVQALEFFESIGEKVRLVKELPMKLVISDETLTMLPLIDLVSMRTSITLLIITHPNFAKAQKEIFISYWDKGITLENYKELISKEVNGFSELITN